MKAEKKKQMMYEAEMQNKMLKNLSKWFTNIMALSTIGIVLAYYGLSRSGFKFAFGIFGAIITVISVIACLLINLAIRNGRKNVNHILELINK